MSYDFTDHGVPDDLPNPVAEALRQRKRADRLERLWRKAVQKTRRKHNELKRLRTEVRQHVVEWENRCLKTEAAAASLAGRLVQTCEWEENDAGTWETSCDRVYMFYDGGPVENGFYHCPYCGATLRASAGRGEEE
jgi:hypothetical protein